MAVDVGSAVGYLDLDISGFLAGLKSAQSEADKQSKNIATKIGNNISGMGKSITSVGTSLTKNVTVPLLGIGAAGLKVATDFEKGMSEVRAISGATGKDFDALREKAIELGADTAFSANEVAAGMTEMAKAGWTSEQILDGMSGVLDAAAASGEGLANVSTIVADTITGFGLAASDSTRVADLLTQAANSGTIGINDLGETFKYLAPVAGAMNLSIEDCTTAISAMSMAGIKGSQAGTSLRTMLTNLIKPTDKMVSSMEELGIVVTNQDGSMKSLDEIVANLRQGFDGLSESEKAFHAATLAGKEGMSGMLALLNLTEEEYNAIAESMDNAGGVAAETAAIMQDNLQSKIEQLGGSLESLAIKLADYVLPYLQRFVVWLTTLVDKFTNLNPETQKTILKFAAIAAAAGPVLVVLGKLITGVGGFISTLGKIPGAVSKAKTGFTALSTGLKNVNEGFALSKAGFPGLAKQAGGLGAKIGSMAASLGPWGAIIAAIIAILIAAFTNLWKYNEEFRNKVIAIWDGVKEKFSNFGKQITEKINSLGFNFENFGEVLKALWQGLCDFLAPIFINVFESLSNTIGTILDVILGIVDFFIAIFKGDWQGAWNAIKDIFITLWNSIIESFRSIGTMLMSVLDVVLGWFGTSWSECWNGIKTFFINIWNGIVSFFTGIWEGIKNVVQVGIMFIVELVKGWFNLVTLPLRFVWENCKDIIIKAWDAIKEKVTTAIDAVKSIIEKVFNTIKSFITTVWDAVKTIVINTWDGIKDKVTNSVNNVKTVITDVFNAIKSTITTVWNTIKDTISSVVDNIKAKFSSGFNAAKNTVTSIFDSIKTKITNVINGARDIVKQGIDKIKSFFNFTWSLPKLKLPHFKIKGKFSLDPPSVPSFGVEWYKKAMNNGMILDTATIFGFNSKTGKFLAGGEAGSETVVGTKNLLSMIRQTVYSAVGPLVLASHELAKASAELGYVTYNGFTKFKESKERQDRENQNNSNNGDIFVFNSPKPIDEIEAAKQMKKAKRELAEGF